MNMEEAIAAQTARRAQAAKNLVVLAALVDSASRGVPPPALSRPRDPFVASANTRSDTRCWEVKLLDQHNRPRTGFLRGPETSQAAANAANVTFKNWTIISIEPSERTGPPPSARAVPAVANEWGVLKRLSSMRRR